MRVNILQKDILFQSLGWIIVKKNIQPQNEERYYLVHSPSIPVKIDRRIASLNQCQESLRCNFMFSRYSLSHQKGIYNYM